MTDTRFGLRDPDLRGYYGEYGGRFVPETVMPALHELEEFYANIKNDPEFQADAKKTKIEFSPSTGEQVARVVQSIMNTPPAVLAKMKKILVQ